MDHETSDIPNTSMRDATTFDRLRTVILRNPEKYGVNEIGMILRRGRTPYYHSNFEDALNYLIGDVKGDAPPGTLALRAKLMQDPETSAILKNPRAERPTTRDLMDKYVYLNEKLPPGRMKIETNKFRPSLWEPRNVKQEVIDNELQGERPTAKDLIRKYNKPKKRSPSKFTRPEWKGH